MYPVYLVLLDTIFEVAMAIAMARISPSDIDLIILATSTPDDGAESVISIR